MLTEQITKECIKAFAYGHTAAQVAAAMNLTVAEAAEIEATRKTDIEAKKAELKEAGYI